MEALAIVFGMLFLAFLIKPSNIKLDIPPPLFVLIVIVMAIAIFSG